MKLYVLDNSKNANENNSELSFWSNKPTRTAGAWVVRPGFAAGS